jgi:hypothetical protein
LGYRYNRSSTKNRDKKYPLEIQLANYIFYAPIEKFGAENTYRELRWKRDHFVDLMYAFERKNKKWYIDVGAGIGFLNCNTTFTYSKKFYDTNGNFLEEKEFTKSSRFFAPRLNIGIHKNKVAAYAMIHKTPNISFKPHPTIAIEFKGIYTIDPFVKRILNPLEKKVKLLAETQKMLPTIAIGIAARPSPQGIEGFNRKPNEPFVLRVSKEYENLIDSRARLTIDIKQRLFKNFPVVLQLSNYFAFNAPYDLLHNRGEKRTLKRDHFLDLLFALQGRREKLNFIVGPGIGLMNCGTKHPDVEYIYNTSLATYEKVNIEQSWRFLSPRLTLGLQRKGVAAYINLNRSPGLDFESRAIAFEFKTAFTITPFKNDKKIIELPKPKILKNGITKISFGLALRTNNIELQKPSEYSLSRISSAYNLHDATPRVFVDLSKKLFGKNSLYINLSNYITYVNIGRVNKNYKLKRDHFVDVVSYMKTKKENTKFLLGVGFGFMNCGTNYLRTDSLGQFYQYYGRSTSSQRFGAPRLIIGLQKNNFAASIISYASSGNNGEKGNPAMWLETKLGYTLSFHKK